MLGKIDEEKMTSEGEIRLFLRLFSILAAHFELKEDLKSGFLFRDVAKRLAEKYEQAAEDELQGDKSFVASLPSVLKLPDVKKPILEDE